MLERRGDVTAVAILAIYYVPIILSLRWLCLRNVDSWLGRCDERSAPGEDELPTSSDAVGPVNL
jgi:hypothetical protein